MTNDPTQDREYYRFASAWTDGSLGPDKSQGVGLLWKEGHICALLISLHRRAPETMRAFGAQLAKGAPAYREDTELPPRRLMAEFVDIMALPRADRPERFAALELPEPMRELSAVLVDIKPPMERKYRTALDNWLELGAAIEARLGSSVSPASTGLEFVPGAKVKHAQWGAGVIRDVRAGPKPLANVDFAEHGAKKVLLRFLELAPR